MRKSQFFVLALTVVVLTACNGLSIDLDEDDDDTTQEEVTNEGRKY